MKFKILALATASLMAIAVPASAQPAKPVYGDWGYNPAAMDTSVKPGDDFWDYVERHLGQEHADRRRPRLRRPVRRLCPTRSRRTSARSSSSSANDPNRDHLGQQIGDYYASFDGQGRDRGRGHRAAEALSRRDRRREDPRATARRCSSSRASRARSMSASARTSRTRTSMPRSPARRRSACRAANIISKTMRR